MELISILITITILFFLILIIKYFIPKEINVKICAICISISLVWISLLILYYFGKFENNTIIALLMGMTILGIVYTVERNVKKELTLFRLPFLLSLFTLGYFALMYSLNLNTIIFLSCMWLLFIIVYFYRNNSSMKKMIDSIVECCKKW